MINEISSFIESIDSEYFTSNLNPSPGLHIKLKFDEKGEVIKNSYTSYIFKKDGAAVKINDNGSEQVVECSENFAKLEYYSSLVNMNKAIDTKKQIHSSSPFILWFKKEKISSALRRIEDYFKNVSNYVNEDEYLITKEICEFSLNELFTLIKSDKKFDAISKTDYIKIYFDVPIEKIINAQKQYLSKKLFVNDDFNISNIDDDVFGLSGFLNGANVKKKFMQHQTSNYLVNNRISQKQAISLYKFEKLLKSKPRKLPNPLPIFIEREELNNSVLRLFGREGVTKFQEIIKRLFNERSNDLTNYYLLNWNNTKAGIVINDLDYVSSFNYDIDGMIIKNVMQLKDVSDIIIKNVFQFEIVVVQKIFTNTLIVKTKKGDILFKYFDEIDSNYCSKITYQNILSYRKNFYDFIYKSKREAITGLVFNKIIISEIIDEIKKNNDFDKTWGIKEKLNILFSLNNYFDKTNKNFGGINMASAIPEYLTKLREIITEDEKHLPDDDNLFAFASGQLIYYIIYQSQTANKTHALLEPYISKSNPKQFKMIITRGIEQYKHSLNFGYNKFDKLASEVLGYDCITELKTLQPMLLAGYFSKSLLLEKKNKVN